MMSLGIQGVPAFIIGSEIIVGLDKGKILESIDYKVVPCPTCSVRTRVPKGKGKIKIKCKKCDNTYQLET